MARRPIVLPMLLLSAALPLLAVALAVAAVRPSADAIAQALTCQCGCGLTVANCNHPNCEFSVPVRDQIERMIAQGKSQEQIIASFRIKYGEKILSAPTTVGFNLLAWIAPFALVLAGCAAILMMCARWRKRQHASTPSTLGELESFAPELRKQLESEVRSNV